MKSLIDWWRTLRDIVSRHSYEVRDLYRRIDELEKVIRDRTEIAVDIAGHRHGENHVIAIGRYKNVDYVQTYSLGETDFCHLVDQLRSMSRLGVVSRIDAPPVFRAVFERDEREGFRF